MAWSGLTKFYFTILEYFVSYISIFMIIFRTFLQASVGVDDFYSVEVHSGPCEISVMEHLQVKETLSSLQLTRYSLFEIFPIL